MNSMQAQYTGVVNGAKVALGPAKVATLKALPDPGETDKGGVRARPDEHLAHLEWLEALGLAQNRKGWWRKTRAGVLYLRDAR